MRGARRRALEVDRAGKSAIMVDKVRMSADEKGNFQENFDRLLEGLRLLIWTCRIDASSGAVPR